MKKIIIIGASSGIGKELAKIYASNDYEVGIAARRTELLNELASEMPTKTYVATIILVIPIQRYNSLKS